MQNTEKENMIDAFMMARMKLQDQIKLVESLLKTNNCSMMNREVNSLDRSYGQMVKIWNSLKEYLSHEEAKKMVDMIDEEDEKIGQTKRTVEKWRAKLAERERVSLESGYSKVSKQPKTSLGKEVSCYKKTRSADNPIEEAELLRQVLDLQERLKQQISLIQNQLWNTNNGDALEGEMNIMEQIHGNMISAATKFLYITDSEEDHHTHVQNLLMDEEANVFEIKKQVIKWIIAREEKDDKSQISRGRRTSLSKILRSLGKAKEGEKDSDSRSQLSGSSRKTMLSDISVGSAGKKQKRKGNSNNEAQRKEQLWDDLGKLKGKLNIQKDRCQELVTTKDTKSLKQEVQNLEETYNEAIETVLRLRELLPADEARNVME